MQELDLDWRQAKCQDDPDFMFPPTGRAHKRQREEAKRICRGRDGLEACPVREACRDLAILAEDYNGGIWGGLSDRERKVFVKTGHDAAVSGSRPVSKDGGVHRSPEARDPSPRPSRADAPGAGRGGGRGAKKAGRPARQRTRKVVVLSTRRLPTNHGCSTARGVGEDAVAGDLRGGPRHPREVAALGAQARTAVRKVEVRRLRVVVDGDIA